MWGNKWGGHENMVILLHDSGTSPFVYFLNTGDRRVFFGML